MFQYSAALWPRRQHRPLATGAALRRTWQRRPELLETAVLTEADKWFLLTLAQEGKGRLEIGD